MRHRDNLAVKIADRLRLHLADYTAGDNRILSTRQLAGRFGVSHQTVYRALRMLDGEKLLSRSHGARAVVRPLRGRMRIACMLCTDFAQVKPEMYSDMPQLVRRLLDELKNAQCEYRVCSFYELQHANFSPRFFDGYDGVVAACSFSDINSRQLVNEFPRPKVWLWNHEPSPDTGNQVIPDFMSGFTELFARARRGGIRRCVLHYSRPFFARVMTDAVLLNNYGEADFTLVRHRLPVTRLDAYKYGLTMTAESGTLHACAMDILACGFVEALLDRGLRPGQFQVSGTGDIEGSGFLPLGTPRLTTLHTDQGEAIRRAVECLTGKIRENDLSTEIIRIRSSLVVRESALA